jgi:TPR repeat protein
MLLISGLIDLLAARSGKSALARGRRLAAQAPARAVKIFAAAAAAGDAEAAFALGEAYQSGRGLPLQPREAARWFAVAGGKGHHLAQCRLAALHLSGLKPAAVTGGLFDDASEGAADYAAALPWARLAAEAGLGEAQAMLGHIFTNGPLPWRDPAMGREWYARAAAQNYPQGRLGLGICLLLGAVTAAQRAAARAEFRAAAEAGLPVAQYLLGIEAEQMADGEGEPSGAAADLARVEQAAPLPRVDPEPGAVAARNLFAQAARAGITGAQVRLALMLIEGRGGAVDRAGGETWLRRAAILGEARAADILAAFLAGQEPPQLMEAAYWSRIAADAGEPAARARLANLLQAGALAHDPPPVHEWFAAAAEQGDPVGAFNYAVCLAEAVGVPRDDAKAVQWLKFAAPQLVEAQYWYGRMLAAGRGVERDPVAAAIWYRRAARAGHREAKRLLGE